MLIKEQIIKILNETGVTGKMELTTPPKPEMGDLSLACFGLAKERGQSPVEIAKDILKQVQDDIIGKCSIVEKLVVVGPYINFYLNSSEVAKIVLAEAEGKDFGTSNIGKKKKIMVEFAHPNTHKAFHIGHLRNAITGESMVRILENVGYKVIRANYQGDVGMHIAKCLWGISQIADCRLQIVNLKIIDEKIKFLGGAYVAGSKAFEESEKAKQEIIEINDKIYSQDRSIKKLYKITRKWSLEYFDKIYKRLGTRFDRLYFESETFKRGKDIALKFLAKKVFLTGEGGAIIFPGAKYGLHDRVFVNSKGFPTYETKDLALAEMQFKEYKPELILHLVAKEQTEYFKVLFKALEFTLPKSKDREKHLEYGWVSLKEGKMSSRTGQVVLGEWLLDEVEKEVAEVMRESKLVQKEKCEVIKVVALAAVKYAFLKTGIKNDIRFDLEESVSLNGDSGPYLLYIVARIRSILRKFQTLNSKSGTNIKYKIPNMIDISEKQLLLRLSEFPEVVAKAAIEYNPSKVARYLFELAQSFNGFYDQCPVLKADGDSQLFRLRLIKAVEQVMERGLNLLGVSTVERM